jgi:hypothetical protein
MGGRRVQLMVFAIAVGLPVTAWAQTPWVPARGEMIIDATYQWIDADRHLFSDLTGPELTPFEIVRGVDYQSNALDFGRVQSHALVINSDVGITDRFALTSSLAYISPRYRGVNPHPGHSDDGDFHPTIQDVLVGARYMMASDIWAFTPFAQFAAPVRDYEVLAHAAQGLGLKQFEIGASVGRILLAGGASKGYVQALYGYSFVESPIHDVSVNRSRAMLEAGWFLGRFTLQGLTSWRDVHGGLKWSEVSFGSHEHFAGHDQAAATREWRWGAGMSFQLTSGTSIDLSYGDFISGANTHDARAMSVGWTWGFQLFGGQTIGGGFK